MGVVQSENTQNFCILAAQLLPSWIHKSGFEASVAYCGGMGAEAKSDVNGFHTPVLKHGPRSLTCMRVFGWQTLMRNESEGRHLRLLRCHHGL